MVLYCRVTLARGWSRSRRITLIGGAFQEQDGCSDNFVWRRTQMKSPRQLRLGLVVSTSALALMLSAAPTAPVLHTGWLKVTAAYAATASAHSESHSTAGAGGSDTSSHSDATAGGTG